MLVITEENRISKHSKVLSYLPPSDNFLRIFGHPSHLPPYELVSFY